MLIISSLGSSEFFYANFLLWPSIQLHYGQFKLMGSSCWLTFPISWGELSDIMHASVSFLYILLCFFPRNWRWISLSLMSWGLKTSTKLLIYSSKARASDVCFGWTNEWDPPTKSRLFIDSSCFYAVLEAIKYKHFSPFDTDNSILNWYFTGWTAVIFLCAQRAMGNWLGTVPFHDTVNALEAPVKYSVGDSVVFFDDPKCLSR